MSLTYKSSGVDRKAVYSLTKKVSKSWDFAAVFDLNKYIRKYKNCLIVSSTDGVGTKIWISLKYNRLKGIGRDLVALNVNDIATCGAKPLFFLDYYCTHKLVKNNFKTILADIINACDECGMELLGGETAIHPGASGFNGEHNIDLAGFVVGIADKSQLLTKDNVKDGDILLGVSSSGLHANGFSLVRKALNKGFISDRDKVAGEDLISVLLKPGHLYSNLVQHLAGRFRGSLKVCANITGGSFHKNLPRVFPDKLSGIVYYGSWKVLPIFRYLAENCKIPFADMLDTFNMGIGYVLVVERDSAEAIEKDVEKFGFNCYFIGKMEKRSGKDHLKIVI